MWHYNNSITYFVRNKKNNKVVLMHFHPEADYFPITTRSKELYSSYVT